MGNEKTVRIGIIGCGGIANGKHMPTLAKMEDALPPADPGRPDGRIL